MRTAGSAPCLHVTLCAITAAQADADRLSGYHALHALPLVLLPLSSAGLLHVKTFTNSFYLCQVLVCFMLRRSLIHYQEKACFFLFCMHWGTGAQCRRQGCGVYLDEEVDEPGSDASPDNVHKEVADGKQPGIWILQALLSQRFHDAGLGLVPS